MPVATVTEPATIRVSTASQLKSVIASVRGGETILLAPGDYGNVLIKGRNLANTVTIQSADPNRDANFRDLRIDQSSGFRFEDIDIHRGLAKGEPDYTPLTYISNASRISFVGVDFFGSMDNNSWNDGYGLRAGASKNISVIDSTFEQLKVGAIFDHVTGIVLERNAVSHVREGFDFAAVHDVTVAQNHFSSIKPNLAAGDHSDAIQFWNAEVKEGSSNVVVRDNVILAGTNGGTAGIFIRAEDPTPAYRHSDFTIVNNLYNGEARNGITLNGVDRATVAGNTLTASAKAIYDPALILTNTTAVTVERNILPLFVRESDKGTIARDNIDVWDMAYKQGVTLDALFGPQPTGTPVNAAWFVVKPGTEAAALRAGFATPGSLLGTTPKTAALEASLGVATKLGVLDTSSSTVKAETAAPAVAESAVKATVAAIPEVAPVVVKAVAVAVAAAVPVAVSPVVLAVPEVMPVVVKPGALGVPEVVPVVVKAVAFAVPEIVPVAVKAVAFAVPEIVPVAVKAVGLAVPEAVPVAVKAVVPDAMPVLVKAAVPEVATVAVKAETPVVHEMVPIAVKAATAPAPETVPVAVKAVPAVVPDLAPVAVKAVVAEMIAVKAVAMVHELVGVFHSDDSFGALPFHGFAHASLGGAMLQIA